MYIDSILDSRILASTVLYLDASSIALLYFPSKKRFLALSRLSLVKIEKVHRKKQNKTIKALQLKCCILLETILEKFATIC